jgi:predicted RNA binding protein YcfA (HicA-like mRNA interferase family)
MTKKRKLIQKLLSGSKNIRFSEAQTAFEAFGFHLTRISGSHHIYTHPAVPELINLQNVNGKAKPYQIKQFFEIVELYNLKLEDES